MLEVLYVSLCGWNWNISIYYNWCNTYRFFTYDKTRIYTSIFHEICYCLIPKNCHNCEVSTFTSFQQQHASIVRYFGFDMQSKRYLRHRLHNTSEVRQPHSGVARTSSQGGPRKSRGQACFSITFSTWLAVFSRGGAARRVLPGGAAPPLWLRHYSNGSCHAIYALMVQIIGNTLLCRFISITWLTARAKD